MTLSEALKALAPPLQFGNPTQVAAVQFLEGVELAKAALARCEHHSCPNCGGFGRFHYKNSYTICGTCGGDGTEVRCACFRSVDSEAVIAARLALSRAH